MHKTLNTIPFKNRGEIVNLLNARLSDALDLYVQSKLAHWNVRGPTFIALHELFDKAAAQADEYADTLAERAAQLGGVATSTTQQIATASTLKAYNTKASKPDDVTKIIAGAWAQFANTIRADIKTAEDKKDAVTADILTGIAGEADKMLWFIEAHLQ